jgi:hypothetical protein
VTVLSLVLLAAGLAQVSFVGTRYGVPQDSPGQPSAATQAPPTVEHDFPQVWVQVLSVAIGVLVLVSLISLIFRPKNLWEALKRAIPAAMWFAAIYVLVLHWRDRSFFGEENSPPGAASPSVEPDQPFPSIEQVQVPSWATFLFILVALLFVGAVLFVTWRLWRARPRPIEDLAEITKQYAHELRTGSPVQETILRCYREMCQLLSERSHIEISRAMTAREFEARLAQMGIHEEHISRLSRLFEWARYSAGQPTPEQEAEALKLLEEIARAYGTTRSPEGIFQKNPV